MKLIHRIAFAAAITFPASTAFAGTGVWWESGSILRFFQDLAAFLG